MTKVIKLAFFGTGAVLGLTITNPINAATISKTDIFELSPTEITDGLLSIEKFDPSFGKLNSVTVAFEGQIIGDAQVESLDAQPQTLTFLLSGNLSLVESTNTLINPLFEESISASDSFDATAFDGNINFTGTSATSLNGLTATFLGENFYDTPDVLNFFTGSDNAEFLFSASSNSDFTGSANIASIMSTEAGSSITVTYDFTEASVSTSEPRTLLGLLAFGGVGLLNFRNKIK